MAATARYVPDFKLRINGEDLPVPVRAAVTSVRLQDGMPSKLLDENPEAATGAANRVEVELANPSLRWLQSHIRGLGFRPFPTAVRFGPVGTAGLTESLFDLDNKLSLELGYLPGPLAEMFTGEITGIEADFPGDGMPTLKLVAHDYLHRLAEGTYGRGFGPIPDFLVAAILSAENLLIPAIDPTVGAASTALAVLNAIFSGAGTKQVGQTDLQLMKQIADTYDADFWVEGSVLYLSRFMKEYAPRLTLEWGRSLISFTPRVSTVGQVIGVAVKFTLREIPLDFLVSVGWDFNREALVVMVVPGAAGSVSALGKSLAGPVLTLINRPIRSPVDITNSALFVARKLRGIINNRLTGRGSAVGDPRIRAGAVIRLEGLGQDFSGDYRVTSATHTIGKGGYRTDFTVRKEIIP